MAFKIGNKVLVKENYEDEQLGQFAPYGIQTVLEVKENATSLKQMIKIEERGEWIDETWFEFVSEQIDYKSLLKLYEAEIKIKLSLNKHLALGDFCEWLQEREDRKRT